APPPDRNHDAGQRAREHDGLVSRVVRRGEDGRAVAHHERVAAESSPVAAAEDGHGKAVVAEDRGHAGDDRRLAASSHAQVAHADDGTGEPRAAEHPPAVCTLPKGSPGAEERSQQSPHAPRPRSRSSVPMSAPRFLSTRPRALAPRAFRRGSSVRRSATACPSVSASGTWRSAPSARNCCSISRKFSMCGPTITGLPAPAGSRMLWPPEGTRLPPTNTTVAKR